MKTAGKREIHSCKDKTTEAGEAQYFLWVERTADGCTAYGFEIRLHTDRHTAESAYIADVTVNRSLAERIYCALWQGDVTPCTLHDVVEDLLTEDSSL